MTHSTKKLGMMFTASAWLLGLLLIALVFSKVLDNQSNPNQSIATAETVDFQQVVLVRNHYGHYVFDGEINHKKVTFLVDTGATTTAIPGNLQDYLGLKAGQPISISTANGTSRAYKTRLDQLAIGGIELSQVKATIAPGMDVGEILLGMNVLKNLELIQRGDKLIIRQYR
jgi:aspartyl protease family protein